VEIDGRGGCELGVWHQWIMLGTNPLSESLFTIAHSPIIAREWPLPKHCPRMNGCCPMILDGVWPTPADCTSRRTTQLKTARTLWRKARRRFYPANRTV
jgi:hypothetical protein